MQEDTVQNPRCPKISFTDEEIQSFYRPSSKALVVKVLERSFSFGAVRRRLENLWARNGNIQVSDVSNSFFLVRFADPDDYRRVAFEGPWKIYDYYFSVARWTPSFNEEEPLKTILTWVRLPKLAIHFFNQVAVSRIGNCIGRTVKIDLATSKGARARYARVCVEVDVTKPLLGKYMIEDRTLRIEYESLENICGACGTYGHKRDCCPSILILSPNNATEDASSAEDGSKMEEDAGDWMVVQRRSKNKNGQKKSSPSMNPPTGSKFEVLSIPEEVEVPAKGSANAKGTDQEREPDVETTKLASQLATVLAQAPCFQKKKSGIEGTTGGGPGPREPLADVSNTVKVMKNANSSRPMTSAGVENSPSLVTVPIIYDNPTFQGSSQASKIPRVKKQTLKREKGSARNGKDDAMEKNKGKEGKNIRSFVTRKSSTDAEQPSSKGTKAGKPPDRA
ncbi:hypothetical protein LINPERHAP1_LOCUS29052 [Linum perenne]